jgi:hypothetical protein
MRTPKHIYFRILALPMLNLKGWPTGLEPAPFSRATIRRHLFLGVARCCRIGLSKPISLLTVACCFCVERSEWCQQWCQYRPRTPAAQPSMPTFPSSEQVHPRDITSCETVPRSSGRGRVCGHSCRARSRIDSRGFRPWRRRTDRLSCRVPVAFYTLPGTLQSKSHDPSTALQSAALRTLGKAPGTRATVDSWG